MDKLIIIEKGKGGDYLVVKRKCVRGIRTLQSELQDKLGIERYNERTKKMLIEQEVGHHRGQEVSQMAYLSKSGKSKKVKNNIPKRSVNRTRRCKRMSEEDIKIMNKLSYKILKILSDEFKKDPDSHGFTIEDITSYLEKAHNIKRAGNVINRVIRQLQNNDCLLSETKDDVEYFKIIDKPIPLVEVVKHYLSNFRKGGKKKKEKKQDVDKPDSLSKGLSDAVEKSLKSSLQKIIGLNIKSITITFE